MRTTRIVGWAAALVVGLGGVAASAQGRGEIRPLLGPASCFPLAVGNRWVYERTGPGGASTWSAKVAEAAMPGSPSLVYRLEGYFPGVPRWVRASRAGTVTEFAPDEAREYLWYLLGAPRGMSWQLQLAPTPTALPVADDCVNGSRLVVVSRDDVVSVPAGQFTRVVRVDFHSRCADAGITSEWFVPGVGLVRREEASIAGPVVSELVQAELGGLALPRAAWSATLSLDSPRYVANLMPPVVPGAAPTARGFFAVRNSTDVPVELTFTGCTSATVAVENEAGEVVVKAHADDGGCCTCTNLVTVTLQHDVLVLPVSVTLSTEEGEPLPAGRYSIAVTLDTVGAAGLRPSARLPFEIAAVY
jgi:hypothetical protein